MDINFMESVMWAFKELYKKGYVYESLRIVPYSYKCETPLSHFETRLDNSYREVVDKSVVCKVKLECSNDTVNRIMSKFGLENVYCLIWTTTPWTLPSNLAIAVNKEIEYALIKKDDNGYILSKNLAKKYSDLIGEDTIDIVLGSSLIGIKYKPLFGYFQGIADKNSNVFSILHGDFVSDIDGTGMVHLAPGFGEEDFNLCSQYNIPIVCPIDNSGKFTKEISDYKGKLVFDAIDSIIIDLKKQNKWLKTEQYRHNYPHCWRTDTPLIYRAISSWYIKVTEFRERMVELNQNITWIPEYVKNNLFGKWLENARDWGISRNRFWGTPIPIWKSNDTKYPRIEVYGSIKEIEESFGVKITDLHKEYLDQLTKPNPDDPTGKSKMIRCEDVFDCWFESGSMPFAQVHYPFENKTWFENNFPADLIIEYSAQTRGWFYTLMVLGTALFDKNPFKNCIAHGVILDIHGQKLSKRLNNYEDPLVIFQKFGSDAMRLTMLGSGVTKGHELKIDSKGEMVSEMVKKIIKPFYNAAHFMMLYQKSDKVTPQISFESENVLDQYILSKLLSCLKSITYSMDIFVAMDAVDSLESFIEILTNWFIRRSRNRFWSSLYSQDKQHAYNTLYTCLIYLSKMSAPIMPFTAEKIYLSLKEIVKQSSTSVHLCDWPADFTLSSQIDQKALEANMDSVIKICSSVLFIRNQNGLKVRQPLKLLTICVLNKEIDISNYLDIIKDEVNIKHIQIIDDVSSIAEKKVTLNFSNIGKRIPQMVKIVLDGYKNQTNIEYFDDSISINGVKLLEGEYNIEYVTKNSKHSISEKDFLLVLDINLDEQLKLEGIARDFVRILQNARKRLDLDITQEIELLYISCSEEIMNGIEKFEDYIKSQCLATSIKFDQKVNFVSCKNIVDEKIHDEDISFGIEI